MRTGRERLFDWVEDIKNDVLYFEGAITSEEWAERIMIDINLGIITEEVDG